jgi:hypothetical protein
MKRTTLSAGKLQKVPVFIKNQADLKVLSFCAM